MTIKQKKQVLEIREETTLGLKELLFRVVRKQGLVGGGLSIEHVIMVWDKSVEEFREITNEALDKANEQLEKIKENI
jgi:hypothetical protein